MNLNDSLVAGLEDPEDDGLESALCSVVLTTVLWIVIICDCSIMHD